MSAIASHEGRRGDPLLAVRDLRKDFPTARSTRGHSTKVVAVDEVSFDVHAGETVGIVGESGSGKSTTGYCVLQLVRPSSGSIKFRGQELTTLKWRDLMPLRREMQIIFQDPFAALNSRRTIEEIVAEPLVIHKIGTSPQRRRRVAELLDRVGIDSQAMKRKPAEFSGGQRQRIVIARALAVEPQFLVCDEAVSALDVSIQAQILNLLKDIQDEFGLALLFIAHDLAVVRVMSDRILVMKEGRIVETGDAEAVYSNPQHGYTRELLESVLMPDPQQSSLRERTE